MRLSSGFGLPSDLLRRETVRFLITGSGAAALFYVLTYGLIRIGAGPFAGTLVAYAVAFVASYSVQHGWTFRGRQAHARSFPRYLVTQLCCAIVVAAVARAVALTGASPAMTALVSTLSGSALAYVLSKTWVFAESA